MLELSAAKCRCIAATVFGVAEHSIALQSLKRGTIFRIRLWKILDGVSSTDPWDYRNFKSGL